MLEDLADVVVATSGEEALRHLLKGEFAVILLDVFMPGMDGYETAQIIRSREQTKRIPIVFLSAVNKENEHLMRGYSMGAVDYVFKPVEPIVLRSKVAVFVDLFDMTRRSSARPSRSSSCSTPISAPMPSGCGSSRSCASPSSARRRSSSRCRSSSISSRSTRTPRWPALRQRQSRRVDRLRLRATSRDHPTLWERPAPSRGSRARARARWPGASGTGAWRSNIAGTAPTASTGISSTRRCCCATATASPAEYAGTLLDVTDRKDLEKQLLQARKMDAIGKLTGGIAHDFNNLLAAVLGGLGLIERRLPLDEEQQKILGMTRRAAEQGSELVGRLLAFARRQQLQPARDRPRRPVGRGDRAARPYAGRAGASSNGGRRTRSGRAFADSTQLELALMNLIINARDAMPKGGTITVAARNAQAAPDNPLGLPAGDYVVLAVTDTGSGIPPDMLEQVTEPFFTTKDVGKGTGLGLSMVYGFARQSGGAIDIVSQGRRGHGGRDLAAARARREGDEAASRPAVRRRSGRHRGRCASCWSTIMRRCARPPPACSATWATRSNRAADGPSLLEHARRPRRPITT